LLFAGESVLMTGPVEKVLEGTFSEEIIARIRSSKG
jgi:hypothetical protein